MFFRHAFPRLCHGMRSSWCPRRWMASRGDLQIRRPRFEQSINPWRSWWGFPHAIRSLDRMEREFDDMWRAMNSALFPRYTQRSRSGEISNKTPELQVNYDDKTFDVRLNVQSYSPEDLQVKIVDEKLVISGRVEERLDEHGSVSGQFTRIIQLPEDVDPDTLTCELTEDGYLDVQARIRGAPPSSERVINIERKPASANEENPADNK
ncbi:protein lethal(2)essential for life-like [Liolophura sinensis]|uniref:protein lethal(2)essential for life-like n=1 Tax=Liolophura sinensis TaxID=3198878 RepID=UPI003158BE89